MLKPATLKISDTTTLRELSSFAGDTKHQGENLRARKVDGHIELYISPAKTGIAGKLDKLNPFARHERRLAQKGLDRVFGNHEKATGAPVSETLTQHVRKPLSSDVKMGTLHVTSTIEAVKANEDAANPEAAERAMGITAGPSVQALGLDTPEAKALLSEAADIIRQKDLLSVHPNERNAAIASLGQDLAGVKQKLGALLLRNFESTNPSDEQRRDFATSMGSKAVRHMEKALSPQAYPGATVMDIKANMENVLTDVAQGAYDHAASQASPDRFVSEHEFRLNGVTYKADPEAPPLGKGGFGTVRKFTSDDGAVIELAVKIPNMEGNDVTGRQHATRLGISECALHKAVEGAGHPNVLAMKGGLRMPGGGYAVVLEMAQNGDLKGFSGNLRSAAKSGAVSPENALLAQRVATRDMLQGLQHCHENGMSNQDVKVDNYLIDAHGVIKLADNGGARTKANISDEPGAHTLDYLSPEMGGGDDGFKTRADRDAEIDHVLGRSGGGGEDNRANPNDVAIRQMIDRQFPKASQEEKDTLVSRYKEASRQQTLEILTAKRDGFALGLAADALIYQKDYAGTEGGTDHYSKYTMETSRLQSLVTDLSNPRFENRMTPSQALKDRALALSPDQVRRGREIIVSVAQWSRANGGGSSLQEATGT